MEYEGLPGMIKYTYSKNYQKTLSKTSKCTFKALQMMADFGHKENQPCHEFTKTMIQFIINHFDADKTLVGLFRLIKFSNKNRISPFLATQDYCVKVLSLDTQGNVELNISPIYHLGPEYPEYYKNKQGKELNRDAIIGLLEIGTPDPDKPSTFNLGIDAGIAFAQATIPHNKSMQLSIQIIDNGIVATLQCEEQSTSKIFSWEQLGIPSAAFSDLYSKKVENIWAA